MGLEFVRTTVVVYLVWETRLFFRCVCSPMFSLPFVVSGFHLFEQTCGCTRSKEIGRRVAAVTGLRAINRAPHRTGARGITKVLLFIAFPTRPAF